MCCAQWRRTVFFAFSCPFPPHISCRLCNRAYSAARSSSCGGPLFGTDRRQLVSAIGVRASRYSTQRHEAVSTLGRIITVHGMATYIQWRHIPDRSESTSESKCKVCHRRSQSPRKLPVLLSTRPRSLGIQIF